MSKLPLKSLFKIIFEGRSSMKFLAGTISGFSFSMAVILCTIGLMDGFELTLKKSLSHANGDIKFTSSKGYFKNDETLKTQFADNGVNLFTTVVQIESFAITGESSSGILLKGIHAENYSAVTKLDFKNLDAGVFIGSQFAKKHNLEVGSDLVIAMASNKSKDQGSPILIEYKIDGIVSHGVYEKDMRFIYTSKSKLINKLNYREGVSNVGYIKIKDFDNINLMVTKLTHGLGSDFNFEPFWSEFEVLLDAVQIEKFTISLILQLIVIVAVFNVIAFIFYISETKAQDFVMLRSLGLSLYSFQEFWFILLLVIWFISCSVAIVLKEFFAYLITNIPYLKIPGDIYVLSELDIILDSTDYLYVFGISLVWILLIGFVTMKRLKNKSIVSELRQEFS
jgi:ABC-type lipoprotein release transport system permease subunit